MFLWNLCVFICKIRGCINWPPIASGRCYDKSGRCDRPHLDSHHVSKEDANADAWSWVAYSLVSTTHNKYLLIYVCCISYIHLCSWLYLEFVDVYHLPCQQIYAGTCQALPRWKEVHTVLIIAHPETENIDHCIPSPMHMQNENVLCFFSIRSFL